MFNIRTMLFSIWMKSGKTAEGTRETVESLILVDYEVVERGGMFITGGGVNGQSFSFSRSSTFEPWEVTESLRRCYRQLEYGGSNGQMTDEELKNYVMDANNEVRSVGYYRARRRGN